MKYELLPTPIPFTYNGKEYILYKIKALETFGDVSAGDAGGMVESTNNLSQLGCCWLYGDSKAFANSIVYGNAKVFDNVIIADNAQIFDCAKAAGNAVIKGNSQVYDLARVYENAVVDGNAKVRGLLRVYGNNKIVDNSWE